ncbi:MAG TPA: extracellular solute-binding protein, partial [Enterovirga sp.]
MSLRHRRCLALAAASFAWLGSGAAQADVNLYTTREPGLVKPLIEDFTKQTGIKVNTVFMNEGLAERVAAEGEKSPADLLMAVDVGNLVDFVDRGVTQPIKSDIVDKAVPANLRDAQGHWFALSMRARVVYAAKDRTQLEAVTYEELSDPKWKGKVCIRSGQHPYNTALIAALIAKHGEAKAEDWLRGVKANLARKASGGDREVARDILGDLCDIGVGNSYYVGLMRSGKGGPDQQKWGEAIKVLLPSFQGGGTHVNISGAALAKHAPNRADAVKFAEYLL